MNHSVLIIPGNKKNIDINIEVNTQFQLISSVLTADQNTMASFE